jgi:hypothetical protein
MSVTWLAHGSSTKWVAQEAQAFRTWAQGLIMFQPLKWCLFRLIEGISEFELMSLSYGLRCMCTPYMCTCAHTHTRTRARARTHIYRPTLILGPYLRSHQLHSWKRSFLLWSSGLWHHSLLGGNQPFRLHSVIEKTTVWGLIAFKTFLVMYWEQLNPFLNHHIQFI